MSYICDQCLIDPYLRLHSIGHANTGTPCDFCESGRAGIELSEIAAECERVIEAHFEPTHLDTAVVIYERDPAGLNLQDTLRSLKVVPEEAIDDLLGAVQELFFDRSTMEYRWGDDDPWFVLKSNMSQEVSVAWTRMEDSLHHQARYLNPTAKKLLDDVLGKVHWERTIHQKSVVVELPIGLTFYRARVFQQLSDLKKALEHPERLLGTPAPGTGPAGRMNGRGQPAFYGATHPKIAIAEVRPPVGSHVAVAAFKVIRPLRLLNLQSLSIVEADQSRSLFDPVSIENAQRRDFLRELSSRLSAPVMPELQERDYLITQVIADYLAMHPEGEIDGILYRSTQMRGRANVSAGDNVVLFSKASQVRGASGGATFDSDLWIYEDDAQYYRPWIQTRSTARQMAAIGIIPGVSSPETWGGDRVDALQLLSDKIEIHEILEFDIETKCEPVAIDFLRK